MWGVSWVVVLVVAGAAAVPMSEDLFYRAPRLFHMDDYERCLYTNGTYCMGVFEISPEEEGMKLYQELMEVSSDRYRLNRSKLHRGVCVSWCAAEPAPVSDAARFERCVDEGVRQHGLRARLRTLHYCRSREHPGIREMDYSDYLFAAVVCLFIFLNAIGTIYDYRRDPKAEPIKFLIAWSIRSNWRRLTAVYSGDPRLDALAPIHGIKAHMIILVLLAHTTLAMNLVYPFDERVVDRVMTSIESTICMNGTMVVQTFAMLSSFLLGYMVLTNFKKLKREPSIKYWPVIVFNRYMRMAPTLMFVVGFTATWTTRTADGPMWYLARQLEGACRRKWWAQLLFINNIVDPDDRCLVQSWFFAVEMQLFLLALALALVLAAAPRRALRVLSALYVVSVAVNFALNISWQMKPVVTFATADNVRNIGIGIDSYKWMFQATWTSLPSCIHGLVLAFIKYNLEEKGFKPQKHKWIGRMTWVLYSVMIAWLMAGSYVKTVSDPFWLAVYASIDRNVWNIIVTFLIFAYINGHGGWIVRYLSWGGFQIMGRTVFSAMLVHWHVNLLGHAASPQPVIPSNYFMMVNWLASFVMTMMLALPLHLLVELPTQRMLG